MKDRKKKQQFSALTGAGRTVDRQVQRLIDYVNDTLVPTTRENTEVLLRRASERLKEMADRLAAENARRLAEGSAPQPTETKPKKPQKT